MSIAVANSTPTKTPVSYSVPIVILGTDAVLAALPATAVQLAHACMQAGFVSVIPASWGDELIAAATLRRLREFGEGAVIQCSCPIVAHRLLSVSGDLRPVLLPLVPPPVALARYVRARTLPNRSRVTYVGGCPGAIDDSIDIRMTPDALLAMLAERQISLQDQPRVFESFIPADRRRFWSQPGGIPSPEALWSSDVSRTVVEVEDDDLAAEIAQQVLTGRNVLIDAAPKLGCVCSGAIAGIAAKDARGLLASLEPPRALGPVVDVDTRIELNLNVPAASRTPIDVMAVPAIPASTYAVAPRIVERRAHAEDRNLVSRGEIAEVPSDVESPSEAVTSPSVSRPTRVATPFVRSAEGREGRTLPRAYVARRRLTPRSIPIVSADRQAEQTTSSAVPESETQPQPAVELDSAEFSVFADVLSAPGVAYADETIGVIGSDELLGAIEIDETLETHQPVDSVDSVVESVEPTAPVESHDLREPIDPIASLESNRSAESTGSLERMSSVDSVAAVESKSIDRAIPAQPADPAPADAKTDSEEAMIPPIGDPIVPVDARPAPTRLPSNGTVPGAERQSTASAAAQPEPPARYVEPAREYVRTAAPSAPLNPRHIVVFLLTVVAVAIVVSAAVAIYIERRFAPHITAPASNDSND